MREKEKMREGNKRRKKGKENELIDHTTRRRKDHYRRTIDPFLSSFILSLPQPSAQLFVFLSRRERVREEESD